MLPSFELTVISIEERRKTNVNLPLYGCYRVRGLVQRRWIPVRLSSNCAVSRICELYPLIGFFSNFPLGRPKEEFGISPLPLSSTGSGLEGTMIYGSTLQRTLWGQCSDQWFYTAKDSKETIIYGSTQQRT